MTDNLQKTINASIPTGGLTPDFKGGSRLKTNAQTNHAPVIDYSKTVMDRELLLTTINAAHASRIYAAQASRAHAHARFVDHPPPNRRLHIDTRERRDFWSMARGYYDSLDIGKDGHALAVAECQPELSSHP